MHLICCRSCADCAEPGQGCIRGWDYHYNCTNNDYKNWKDPGTNYPLRTLALMKARWAVVNKAARACKAINAAIKATEEVVDTFSLMTIDGRPEVQVYNLIDMNQIPGQIQFAERKYCEQYTHEAFKILHGVKFFYLLTFTREEYEAAKMREAS